MIVTYLYWETMKQKQTRFPTLKSAMLAACADWKLGDKDPMYVIDSDGSRYGLRLMFEYWKQKGWEY